MLLRETLDEFHIFLTFIVCALGQLPLHLVDALLETGVSGERLARLFAHGGIVLQTHDLRQITYRRIVGHGNHTGRRLLHAAEYFEHGRFAGSVLAHKSNAVTMVYHKTDVAEQWLYPEFDFKSFY